jgi:TolB-like protein
VLYEMLAGSPPFHGATAQILRARHTLDPAPSLRTARPNLSPALDAVVQRTLAKMPADRFSSIRAFLDALTGAASGALTAGAIAAPPKPGRRLVLAAGAAALLVLGALGAVLAARWLGGRVAPNPPGGPRLAVLPFTHVGKPEDRYIAEGLTEEIRSRVAGISGLTVIARASAANYQSGGPLADVARELQVQYVVTGTVRTDRAPSGEGQVRVTPHLIRVDGTEVWSEGFDAQLAPGGLFEMQSSIAKGVAKQLNVSLLLPEQVALTRPPTENAEAYQAFLRGNVYASHRYQEEPARLAVESYAEAVRADPRFALGYARLAEAQTMYYYFHDKARARLDTAATAITRAIALDSTLLEARLARGYLSWWGRLDADSALADLNAVRRQEPNNSEVFWIIGNVERRSGKWVESLEPLGRAFQLDPRSQVYALDISTTLLVLRRYDDAMRYADRALELAPDWVAAVLQKSLLYWEKGDSLASRRVVREARGRISVLEILKYSIRRHPQHIVVLGGDIRDSLEALPSTPRVVDPAELYLAKAYSFEKRGDSARARAHFDSARVVLEPRAKAAPGEADFHSMLGVAYAGMGRRDDAIREGELAMEILPLSKEAGMGVFPLTSRIRIALLNGEHEVALRHLATLLAIPSVLSKALVKADPFFEQLRSDPRFAELVRGGEHRF